MSPQGTRQLSMPCPARGCRCPSHLTCRPLCTPGWPRCTRGGDSGAAARCWFGVCRTSRTSSVLRERARGRGSPSAMSDGDLLTAWLCPSLGERFQQHQDGRSPLFHPHPGAGLAGIISQWRTAPTQREGPPALCPPITPQKEKRNAVAHLKTHGRRGRGGLRERGAGTAAAPARPGLR